MTSDNDDAARRAMRVQSLPAPEPAFALEARVWFNLIAPGSDPSSTEIGKVVGRYYSPSKRLHLYQIDTGSHIWHDVPEDALHAVITIAGDI